MTHLAPIDRLILATPAQCVDAVACLQDCVEYASDFLPNATPITVKTLLPRYQYLNELGLVREVGRNQTYTTTDISLASLQHGIRIGGFK